MSIVSEQTGNSLLPIFLTDIHLGDADNFSITTIDPMLPEVRTSQGVTFNILYVITEVVVAASAVFGNALVIAAFKIEKKLRKRTNYYIVSLAAADLLVGLVGIPVAIIAAVAVPDGHLTCLTARCLLIVLCAISIYSLVAVSADRYWAILHPMSYSQNITTRITIGIIVSCWVAGILLGILPLFGWNAGPKPKCQFTEIMAFNYLILLYFAAFTFPTLLLIVFYSLIYRVVLKQLRHKSVIGSKNKENPENNRGSKTMLRILGANQQREVKIAKKLAIIVIFFILCWIPLHTSNCIKAFCPKCYVEGSLRSFFIILSHLNSAINPLLYACHLKDFRTAFQNILLRDRKKRQRQQSMFHVKYDTPENSFHNAVRSPVNDYLIRAHDPMPSPTPISSTTGVSDT